MPASEHQFPTSTRQYFSFASSESWDRSTTSVGGTHDDMASATRPPLQSPKHAVRLAACWASPTSSVARLDPARPQSDTFRPFAWVNSKAWPVACLAIS